MNEQNNKLTLQETEQLCEFFMDCKLSVLQENELRYVLSQIDYHSPLIDDTRALMGIELSAFDKPVPKSSRKRKSWETKKITYFSVAASLAILVCLGTGIFQYRSSGFNNSTSKYIAYVDGKRLSNKDAKAQVESDILLADNFLDEMSAREESEKIMIDNFFNN